MDISNAAEDSGSPTESVRYYADIGLVDATRRSESGYQNYDEAAVTMLAFVRRSREFGISIDQCKELLGLCEDSNRTSAEAKHIASSRLEEIREKQRELQRLHDELHHLVTACNGDERPTCPIIDYLG